MPDYSDATPFVRVTALRGASWPGQPGRPENTGFGRRAGAPLGGRRESAVRGPGHRASVHPTAGLLKGEDGADDERGSRIYKAGTGMLPRGGSVLGRGSVVTRTCVHKWTRLKWERISPVVMSFISCWQVAVGIDLTPLLVCAESRLVTWLSWPLSSLHCRYDTWGRCHHGYLWNILLWKEIIREADKGDTNTILVRQIFSRG